MTNFTGKINFLKIIGILFLLSTAAFAAKEKTFEFTNKTGQEANDLHIRFVQGAHPVPEIPGQNYGAFTDSSGAGSTSLDFEGGSVPDGGSTKIKFKTSSSKLTIKEWWWTWNGDRIGELHDGKNFAAAAFDQTNVNPSEVYTVTVYAEAEQFEPASFIINVFVFDTFGAPIFQTSRQIDLAPGDVYEEQIFVGSAEGSGEQHVLYDVYDAVSNETMDGDGTLFVGMPDETPIE